LDLGKKWVPEALSQEVKRPGCEGDHSSPSSVEVKNSGAVPPVRHTSSWRGIKFIKHRDNFTFTDSSLRLLQYIIIIIIIIIYKDCPFWPVPITCFVELVPSSLSVVGLSPFFLLGDKRASEEFRQLAFLRYVHVILLILIF
jgi:hypothetical protein